ncbi:MAG: hypothetical protein IOD12_03140 [Silvanigrellales bacterium]|nr:hypothetical protein [Silvanigrellales bacterium]
MNTKSMVALIFVGCLIACSKGGAQEGSSENPPVRAPISDDTPGKPRSENSSGAQNPNGGNLKLREEFCKPTQTVTNLPPLLDAENPKPVGRTASFDEVKNALVKGCAGCHAAPKGAKGGFSFVPEFADKSFIVTGEPRSFPGIVTSLGRIRDSLVHPEPRKRMPQGVAGTADAATYVELARTLDAWKTAGTPEGVFVVPDVPGAAVPGNAPGNAYRPRAIFEETDLGDCIPNVEEAGHDPEKDAYFASATRLPKLLSETDLFTIDSLELARKGTFSYNVEYPLWADNAEKGRFVHVPSRRRPGGRGFERIPAAWNPDSKRFELPENTRFYKTFYKAVKRRDGKEVFRKIETRILVVRKESAPLLGTYVWNEDATQAVLHDAPYRDGTGFKDKTFPYVSDEVTGATRTYALPGEQRCIECHKGQADFALGFTALQLNRRALGEAGREFPVAADERAQVERLAAYGVLANVPSEAQMPKLETARGLAPRNVHEARLQGYMVGNCAHCHNPDGFAMKENKVKLDLTEGRLYDFNARSMRSIHFDFSSNKVFVNTKAFEAGEGNVDVTREALRQSYLYLRVSASPKDRELLPFNAMPMHTPGGSNCRLVNLTAKWILSQVPGADADAYTEACEPHQEFSWIDLDSTESPEWQPRRADWNTPEGMPESFRTLVFADDMKAVASREYPIGFYDAKPTCRFPDVEPPAAFPTVWTADVQKWMFRNPPSNAPGNPAPAPEPLVPSKPLGQLYRAKPGAYLYSSMCAKCHGSRGDGQGSFATSLTVMSDGEIRVANFTRGLFLPDGANIARFGTSTPYGDAGNLAGNYLIWMAMGGTKVNFPPEVSHLTGKHKALMLNLVRDRCSGFLPNSGTPMGERFYDYGLLRDLCFLGNGDPENIPADLGFLPETIPPQPIDPVKQDAWLDKAAFNAGWSIYHYLKEDASQGRWQPALNECEVKFGAP